MASEIRVNQIQNRSGLTTTTLNDQGVVVAGIVTANSFSGDISGSSTYADFTGGVGIGTVNGQVTFTGQTDVRKAGAASFVVGSSDASGATIAIDGDSNGDGNGADYAFLTHDTDGDLQIVVDNPSNAGNILFKTSSQTPEKVRIKSDGTLFVRSGNDTQGTSITGTSVGVGTTTTAGRNAGVGTANGTLVYNSTDNALEMYANNEWQVIQKKLPFNVSGGTISNDVNRNNFVTHTFTSPGNFVSGGEIVSAEIFVIGGGGGGGGNRYGAGGGGGGAMLATGVTLDPGTYAVSIGSGGNGGPGSAQGSDGGNTIFHPGGPQQRQGTGGGGGGSYDSTTNGRPGGSGGGAGARPGSTGGPSSQPSAPGSGTDYGNRGGNYNTSGNGWAPAGGGGAGAQGTDSGPAQYNGGGNGGDGVQLSISGTATYYGGGGGASAFHNISPSAPSPNTPAPSSHKTFGGAGGGGTGASSPDVTIPPNSSPGANATANTGSGGAGAHSPAPQNFNSGPGVGGNGAAGLVIVAYPSVDNSVST